MPWTDWQFWVATLGALAAVAFIVRPLLGRRGGSGDGCAPARPRRATLTIGDTDRGERADGASPARTPGVSDEGSRGPGQGPPPSSP